jgi:hypothetical protein
MERTNLILRFEHFFNNKMKIYFSKRIKTFGFLRICLHYIKRQETL